MEPKMTFVIFDIDNCIANDARRQKHLPRYASPVPYPESAYYPYHSNAEHDEAINAHVLNAYISAGSEAIGGADIIVFITSRPERYRHQTEQWLRTRFENLKLSDAPDWTVLMRPRRTRLNIEQAPALKVKLFEDFSQQELGDEKAGWAQVVAAYDDREDVLRAYQAQGVEHCIRLDPDGSERLAHEDVIEIPAGFLKSKAAASMSSYKSTTPQLLEQAAETFRIRNATYGNNYLQVSELMKVLWPDGFPSELVFQPEWHLFELILVKLTRFANGNLTHIDSIHDTIVYAAMIEDIITPEEVGE